jgi:hypothetical protein
VPPKHKVECSNHSGRTISPNRNAVFEKVEALGAVWRWLQCQSGVMFRAISLGGRKSMLQPRNLAQGVGNWSSRREIAVLDDRRDVKNGHSLQGRKLARRVKVQLAGVSGLRTRSSAAFQRGRGDDGQFLTWIFARVQVGNSAAHQGHCGFTNFGRWPSMPVWDCSRDVGRQLCRPLWKTCVSGRSPLPTR